MSDILGFNQPTLDPKVISFGASLHPIPCRSPTLIQYSFPFDEVQGFYSWLLHIALYIDLP